MELGFRRRDDNLARSVVRWRLPKCRLRHGHVCDPSGLPGQRNFEHVSGESPDQIEGLGKRQCILGGRMNDP